MESLLMEQFTPPNPRYKERVEESFSLQPMQRTLGTSLGEIKPGYCEIHLPFQEGLAQHHGFLHGGVFSLLLDTAGGYASYTMLAPTDSALTVEYKVNMLRPGKGERFIARGQVIKPGKTIIVVQADLYAVDNGQEHLCATSLQTIMRMSNMPDNSNRS